MTRASKPKPLLRLSEREVVAQCIGVLRTQGYTCIRLNSGLLQTPDGRRIRIGDTGMPDWIVLRGSEYCLLEIKATGKSLTAEQTAWHADAKRKSLRVAWTNELEGLRHKVEGA